MSSTKPPVPTLPDEVTSAIADAIEAASQVPGAHPEMLLVADVPVRISPKGTLHIDTSPDPGRSMVLILDPKAGMWKFIVLPPSARWVLQAETGPKAGLWTPGKPQ